MRSFFRSLRHRSLLVPVVLIGGLVPMIAACGSSSPQAKQSSATQHPPVRIAGSRHSTSTTGSAPSRQATPPATPTTPTTTTTTTVPTSPGTLPAGEPLAGKVVGIDPGHDGLNYTDPSFLDKQIFNGRAEENCDTTGTETAGGYSEAQYNFNVAQYLASDLVSEGAKVVLTRSTNNAVGPCVDQRAQIINSAHADVAIDIHADGGPPDGRGFAILEPVADGPNSGVIASSEAFGSDVRSSFQSVTGMPISTYDGTNGIAYRDDLAGLNLTTVPKVLIECGNMQNGTDAAMLTAASFQQSAASALAQAITTFLS